MSRLGQLGAFLGSFQQVSDTFAEVVQIDDAGALVGNN
jgi:hypothetical protein